MTRKTRLAPLKRIKTVATSRSSGGSIQAMRLPAPLR
jgi:hypothetical protein